jgi:hypothetical protein
MFPQRRDDPYLVDVGLASDFVARSRAMAKVQKPGRPYQAPDFGTMDPGQHRPCIQCQHARVFNLRLIGYTPTDLQIL